VRIVNTRNASRAADLINPANIALDGRYAIDQQFIEPTVLMDRVWRDAARHLDLSIDGSSTRLQTHGAH
jgi:hypothetical protein